MGIPVALKLWPLHKCQLNEQGLQDVHGIPCSETNLSQNGRESHCGRQKQVCQASSLTAEASLCHRYIAWVALPKMRKPLAEISVFKRTWPWVCFLRYFIPRSMALSSGKFPQCFQTKIKSCQEDNSKRCCCF